MTAVLIKGGNLETDTRTGRTLREDEGRVSGDASTSPGTPKIASKSLEPRGEVRNRFFLIALRKDQVC